MKKDRIVKVLLWKDGKGIYIFTRSGKIFRLDPHSNILHVVNDIFDTGKI